MSHRTRSGRKRETPLPRILALFVPAAFLISVFSQAVFATTYVITDGERVITHATFASDPAVILSEAGLNLEDADTFTSGRNSIVVHRGQRVLLSWHGEERIVTSPGETVEALLKRLHLDPDSTDMISAAPGDMTFDGMTLRVDRVVYQEETYSALVPREVSYCNAPGIPAGMVETLSPGRDGELLRTAAVTYINGREASREILRNEWIAEAVDAVVATGTGHAIRYSDGPVITESTITLPTGEVLTYTHTGTVRATAYTHTDAGCNTVTSTGSTVHIGTVAVDPTFIPYGTRMFIAAEDGSYIYGLAEAEDCGGAIKGDRVDLYLPTFDDCIQFGRRKCTVYYLG